MMDALGHKRWAIPEGHIPSGSNGPSPDLESHDSMSILNASKQVAHIHVTVFFADKDPVGPYLFEVAAERTAHIRFNNFADPAPIPRDTDYSSVIESDVPVVVQYTRLDSRQAENALLSVMAFPS
jgi:hypothetical protein